MKRQLELLHSIREFQVRISSSKKDIYLDRLIDTVSDLYSSGNTSRVKVLEKWIEKLSLLRTLDAATESELLREAPEVLRLPASLQSVSVPVVSSYASGSLCFGLA